MAIKVTKDLFGKDKPGYEYNGRLWTKSTNMPYWADAVRHCESQNTKLQTLDEAIEFMCDIGSDGSIDEQHTSTLLVIRQMDKNKYLGYAWEPSRTELQRMIQEPCFKVEDEPEDDIRFSMDYFNSPLVDRLFTSVQKTGRIFYLPSEGLDLSLRVNSRGESEYSQNHIVNCLMNEANAKKYAALTRKSTDAWFAEIDLPIRRPSHPTLQVYSLVLNQENEMEHLGVGDYIFAANARGVRKDKVNKNDNKQE